MKVFPAFVVVRKRHYDYLWKGWYKTYLSFR